MSEQQPETRKCAVCGKPQDAAYRPFCSKRCADIDLGRWLKEGYSIPGGEPPPDEGGEES
ncbi:MAG: DNA gyrase inhibitor YacG [Proteobacteria bacterium]|nr:DNA gyrase inhibitor YacG [Pseudomonadota bacterium]